MKLKLLYLLILISNISVFSQHQNKQHRDVNVYFDTAVYTLNENEKKTISKFIKTLGKEKILKITLYGYTDDRGSLASNLVLSRKRAKSVKTYLLSIGINKEKFKIVKGKGEVIIKKFNEVETDVVRGLNRKVTIDITTIIPKVNETLIKHKIIEPINIGDRYVLENLHFQEGYAWFSKKSFPHLKELAKVLTDRPDLYIEIQGHVCCTRFGRDAINRKTKKQNLSKARAKAVYMYLRRKGIAKERMRYRGMRHLVPLNKGAEYDRRVEIIIKNIVKKRKFRAK